MALDWKKVVRAVAPTVAGAFGGPIAKAAVQAIGEKILGKPDATETEVEAALAGGASFEQVVKLKELEQEFALKMRESGIDLARIDADDRASARQREASVRDWVTPTMAVSVNIALFAVMAAMLRHEIPPSNRDAFYILLGTLGTGTTSVWAYYFGSSSGSKQKTDLLGKALSDK